MRVAAPGDFFQRMKHTVLHAQNDEKKDETYRETRVHFIFGMQHVLLKHQL